MSPLKQVKERIERMRITRPDDNGLCKLLDFVEGIVKEEKGYQMKQNKLAELVQLVKELQEWRDGYGLYQSGQKESFNAILAKASQIAEPTANEHREEKLFNALKELYAVVNGECPQLLDGDRGGCAWLDMEIEDLLKVGPRYPTPIPNPKPPVNDMAGLVETKLGQGELEFDGVESSWHVPTNWRSDGFKCCGKYGELIFRYKKEN